jgi:cyclopropane fatty-acyl-phospholipid synthase-like methyltransferase
MAMKESLPTVIQFWDNVVDEFDSIYTGKDQSPLSRWANSFFRKDIYQRREWTIQRAGDLKGKSVIDIGCGPGRFCTDYVKAGAARVLGMDTSPKMIERAKQVAAQEGTAGPCEWVVSDILDFQSQETFDRIVAMGFWDYIEEPDGHLKAIRRHMKPGGRFLSSWPILWSWRVPIRIARLRWFRGCPCYFFTRGQLQKMFDRTGWKITECKVVGKIYLVEAEPK